MIELWIPITVLAALLQCLRTAVQKRLTASLSTNAATLARYLYGFPLAALYLLALTLFLGGQVPSLNASFLAYCLLGGVTQILATALLLELFKLRNFVVGTTYSKTEVVQTALFGFLILREPVSLGALLAIVVSFAGVILLSLGRSGQAKSFLTSVWDGRAAAIGLASGGFFAVTAVCVRAASLSLGGEGFLLQAGFTLAVMTLLQTVILGVYMAWREWDALKPLFTAWRSAGLVGLLSATGSICWFTAMTLENVAYVRTLGQVELVFTYLVSRLAFKERPRALELLGVLLIVLGIVVLLG